MNTVFWNSKKASLVMIVALARDVLVREFPQVARMQMESNNVLARASGFILVARRVHNRQPRLVLRTLDFSTLLANLIKSLITSQV